MVNRPGKAFQIRFRNPECRNQVASVRVIHVQSALLGILWKPTAVLPREFKLKGSN
jgi:hypothetical protein